MTFITKKRLPRRTFLLGTGVTLALPILASMVPARTALAQTGKEDARGLHLHPARRDDGQVDAGRRTMRIRVLRDPAAAPFRDRTLVISDLAHAAVAPSEGEGTGGRTITCARRKPMFLSRAHPVKKNAPSAFNALAQ